MKGKVDLRILKTRKAIKEAFLKLIKEKGYEHITIQDISDEAMINRNTFYLHYIDKQDLMDKICKESLNSLDASLRTEIQDMQQLNKAVFTEIFVTMFQSISTDIKFFQIMLSGNGQQSFFSKLKDVIKNHIQIGFIDSKTSLKPNYTLHDKKLEISLEYMISGIVGVICYWINNPEYSISETSQLLCDMHYRNVMDLLEK